MSNTLATVLATKQGLEEFANLVAHAVIKQTTPSKDLISTNQAYKEFDRRWVDSRTKAGHLHPKRMGPHPNSPRKYSRMECIALLEAERNIYNPLITKL